MKKYMTLGVIGMCLLSLFGCFKKPFGKNDPFILDGPGMVYEPKWESFSISQTSDYSNDLFWFTVTDHYQTPTVIGECRDQTGTVYEAEEGIPLTFQTIADLRDLQIEDLNDVVPSPEGFDEEEPEILDGNVITLTFVAENGFEYEKVIDYETAMKIHSILLPYFVASNQ